MKRLIREPLVHFVLIAVAIFVVYGWLSDRRASDEQTIRVTAADIDRMAALFTTEAGGLPSEQDMRTMILDHIEQQALAREARRLGLAEGDTVVERRLAQKMSFMITDMEAVTSPEPGELEEWFAQNQALFVEPDRISFQHVFFTRADDPRLDETMQALRDDPEIWRSLGDPFMLQRTYSELPPREIGRLFGSAFANEIAQANREQGTWSAPVASALGVHLVRVTARREGGLPELETIRDRVQTRWQEENGRAQAREAVAAIVDRYTVEIEGISEP